MVRVIQSVYGCYKVLSVCMYVCMCVQASENVVSVAMSSSMSQSIAVSCRGIDEVEADGRRAAIL